MRSLAVVLAVVVIGLSCSNATPTPTPTDPNGEWEPTTAWEKTLARIQPDGSVDLDTALIAFSLAIAPLPGVTLPPEDAGPIEDGTEAIRWLKSHWSELTDAQRTEAERHLVPAAAAASDTHARPAARGGSQQLLAAIAAPPLVSDDRAAAPDPPAGRNVQAALDAVIPAIAKHMLRPLGIPVTWQVNPTEEKVNDSGAAAYATVVDDNGDAAGGQLSCVIFMNPSGMAADDVAFTAIVAHEAFHCFQFEINQSLREFDIPLVANPWVIEGQAGWAGETIAAELTGIGSSMGGRWWVPYLLAPKKPLVTRSYDAIGFYARLAERGQDPWLVFDDMLTAANGLEAFHYATDKLGDAFADSWASGYFEDGAAGRDWDITQGVAKPSGREPKPALITLANGDSYRINVKAYANAIFVLEGPAEIARFQITGRARLNDQIGYQVIGLDGRDFCLKDPCECPPKMHFKVDPPGFLTPQLKIAVSGSTDGALGAIIGLSLDELCAPDATPGPSRTDGGDQPPCRARCAMSNGDPHLLTVDGRAYDFQAAGEFTVLRSDDGSVDIQVRQEPYEAKTTVSINTAVALRANGRRVGLTIERSGTIDVRVDGTPVTDPSVDLGGGASVVGHPEGVEIALTDGSSIWALLRNGFAEYGINLVIAPSTRLREGGKGILGRTSPGGAGLPSLPDGTSLPRLDDPHARFVQLYGAFADAWRVTDGTSLFDYAPGTSTTTYTKPGFPSEADTVAQQAIPLDSVPGATEACAPITDPYLRAQCVFDIAVTNNLAFANQYALSQRFIKQGSGALDPAGGAPGPLPSPTPRSLPPSVTQILPAGTTLRGQALAPDRTLYLSVEYPGDRFEVLAVDPRTATVMKRADAMGGGQVAFAAGSVWVGEFAGTSGGCSVARLDSTSLAVQATVASACTMFGTALAGTADAVWVHDPTAADADAKGGHLRRIDPATNAFSTEVAIPFAYGFLTASSSHVFYGDTGRGHFRVADGGTTLEPLGVPDAGFQFPAGDGIWTQLGGGPALRFATPGGPSQSIAIDGSLVAADTETVYSEEGGGEGRLWRYPLDGSERTVIGTRGSEGPDADIRFDFTSATLLLVGDTGLVALWPYQPDESSPHHEIAFAMRWVPLP